MNQRYKSPYIVASLLFMCIFPKAVEYAYIERGYKAYGGEFLLPVIFIAAAYAADSLLVYLRKKQEKKRDSSSNYYCTKEKGNQGCQIQ